MKRKIEIDLYENSVPWTDTTKWNPDFWYPLPLGLTSRDTKNWHIDSYGVFKLDNPSNGDIIPIIGGNLTLSQALEICEDFNSEKFIF